MVSGRGTRLIVSGLDVSPHTLSSLSKLRYPSVGFGRFWGAH